MMTALQALRAIILTRAAADEYIELEAAITADNVDELYDEHESELHDARNEVRHGECETPGIPTPYSRHYEAKAVAAKAPNGQWVGWTYWYGGGKHGEPEAIDWMEEAYLLNCDEQEQLVVVQTFSLAEI